MMFAKEFFRAPVITRISEIYAKMPHGGLGYKQFKAVVDDKAKDAASTAIYQRLLASTVLVGLDAFYWASSRGDAECDSAVQGVKYIIDFGKTHNKPIILGNAPHDTPFGILGYMGWGAPDAKCLSKINAALSTQCTLDNNCYLVDVYRLAEKLKNSGIYFEGQLNRLLDLRFDSLHFSEKGIRYAMKLVDDALKQNLPQCSIPAI